MNQRLIEQAYPCPYCGEQIETLIDVSQGSQQTIEDCSVCCRPIELNITVDEVTRGVHLVAQTDND